MLCADILMFSTPSIAELNINSAHEYLAGADINITRPTIIGVTNWRGGGRYLKVSNKRYNIFTTFRLCCRTPLIGKNVQNPLGS